jgi:hypothetical protein
MNMKKIVRSFCFCCLIFSLVNIFQSCSSREVQISIDKNSPMEVFGASRIVAVLNNLNRANTLIDNSEETGNEYIQVKIVSQEEDLEIKKEGFRIRKSGKSFTVSAIDETGAMYGLLDIAEQIQIKKGISGITEKLANPRFDFRAVKYNLPWVSYRANESLQANTELSRDLDMWAAFLDMMAESRLNALTLWSLHPFPYMIRATNFPKATPFSDDELKDWKTFWTALFKMAKERGIETYIINWNIIVSRSFREHYCEGNTGLWADGFTSPLIEQYTRETVTQLLNEYPDLTGLGVTPGEAMQGWDGYQMASWFERTFFEGIKAADRDARFIYRASLHGDHSPHREAINNAGIATPEKPIIVELKFNWSHGHSTTTLIRAHGGRTGKEYWEDPAPTHHKMGWMIRNEDFIRLRWGQPDFIREHIAVNGQDYVGGYFIGSEVYIPAKDIFTKPHRKNWDYEFERKWLYYKQWGRLLYDPGTSNAVFANGFNKRYQGNIGDKMVEAYKLSTTTTQRIAQFFHHTWDHSFYTEGLIGNKRDFITIEEFINHRAIEPNFVTIRQYGDGSGDFGTKATPLQVAAELEEINQQAINIVNGIRTSNEILKSEIDDVIAWAHLGLYFAKKIRTAVALNQNRHTDAVAYIQEARQHWIDLVNVTTDHYQPSHLGITENHFHWKNYQGVVDNEVEIVKNWQFEF